MNYTYDPSEDNFEDDNEFEMSADSEDFNNEEQEQEQDSDVEVITAESQAEEEEVDGKDFVVPIEYTDEYGNKITEDVPYSKLGDLLKVAKKASAEFENYTSLQNLALSLERDPLVKEIMARRKMGYSEDQIRIGLAAASKEVVKEETPLFDTVEQETMYYAKKAAEQETKALKEKMAEIENNTRMKEVASSNDLSWAHAFSSLGWDFNLTQDRITKINGTIRELYPGLDISKQMISQAVARNIVMNALGQNTQQEPAKTTSSAAKEIVNKTNAMKGLPNKIGKVPTGGRTNQRSEPMNQSASREQRMARYAEL